MTADIGPGVMLEALESFQAGYTAIEKGRIYTCTLAMQLSGCGAHGTSCKMIGVHLREAPVRLPWAFCSDFFRPIRRPDTETLLRQLCTDETAPEGPVRRDVPEPVTA